MNMRFAVLAALLGIAFARNRDRSQNVEITNPGTYHWFPSPLPHRACTITFQVKASRDAVITFSPRKSLVTNVYQAILGAYNNLYVCIVRKWNTYPVVERSWYRILTGKWQTFWVEYRYGAVSVMGEVRGKRQTLTTYKDYNPLYGTQWYVGVTSLVARSEWRILSSESCGIIDQRDPVPRRSDSSGEERQGDRGRTRSRTSKRTRGSSQSTRSSKSSKRSRSSSRRSSRKKSTNSSNSSSKKPSKRHRSGSKSS